MLNVRTLQATGTSLPSAGGAIIVVALLAFAAVPVDAGPDQAEYNRYRAELFAQLPGVNPTSMGTVYLIGESYEVTGAELADLYAERMVALEQAAEDSKRGRDRGSGGGTSSSSANGPLIGSGVFSLIEHLEIRNGNPSVACSNLQEQAHYTVAVPTTDSQYVGAAYSDVAALPGGSGRYHNVGTDEQLFYSHEVYYGGASNFFCAEMRTTGGNIALLNNPTVEAGFVVGADP